MKIQFSPLPLSTPRGATRRSVVFGVFPGFTAGIFLALNTLAVWGNTKSEITIDNFTFSPAELNVVVGTTVTWVNHDDIPHSVIENDKNFRSKALDTDETYAFTFKTPGVFKYFCGLHPHMTGTIFVKP